MQGTWTSQPCPWFPIRFQPQQTLSLDSTPIHKCLIVDAFTCITSRPMSRLDHPTERRLCPWAIRINWEGWPRQKSNDKGTNVVSSCNVVERLHLWRYRLKTSPMKYFWSHGSFSRCLWGLNAPISNLLACVRSWLARRWVWLIFVDPVLVVYSRIGRNSVKHCRIHTGFSIPNGFFGMRSLGLFKSSIFEYLESPVYSTTFLTSFLFNIGWLFLQKCEHLFSLWLAREAIERLLTA